MLRLLELIPILGADDLSNAVSKFVDSAWRWIKGERVSLTAFYDEFFQLSGAFNELGEEHAALGQAVFMGAYCVLWEVYAEAWDSGEVDGRELPAEICEGDVGLWDEFSEALIAIQGEMSSDIDTLVSEFALSYEGDPTNRTVTVPRSTLASAIC